MLKSVLAPKAIQIVRSMLRVRISWSANISRILSILFSSTAILASCALISLFIDNLKCDGYVAGGQRNIIAEINNDSNLNNFIRVRHRSGK